MVNRQSKGQQAAGVNATSTPARGNTVAGGDTVARGDTVERGNTVAGGDGRSSTSTAAGPNSTPADQAAAGPGRIFLGWDRPVLESAAEWLLAQAVTRSVSPNQAEVRPKLLDLTDTLVVIPAARARRRLLQLLALRAGERGATLLPPHVVTVGNFPEWLYESAQPLADPATRLLAWLTSFQGLTLAERQLFLPRLSASDVRNELRFAQQLAELHRRLGMEVRCFRSVYEHLEKNPHAGDLQRWEVLAKVQASYYERLSRQGLWDSQAARNVAIRKQLCRTALKLVIVGAVDLTESNRQMLLQLGQQVTALVFAPLELSGSFDAVGGLVGDAWLNDRLGVPAEHVRIVDRPTDQAEEVLAALREWEGQFTADQVTIGVPDDQLVPPIELALQNAGVPVRRLEGQPLKSSPAVRLAECLADYLARPDFSLFAQLVRHPDLFDWLSRTLGRNDWLPTVDNFQSKFLASRFPLWEPLTIPVEPEKFSVLTEIQAGLRKLLEPFAGSEGLPLDQAAQRWRWFLEAIYGDQPADDSAAPDLAGEGDELQSESLAPRLLIQAFTALERCASSGRQLAGTAAPEPFAKVTFGEALTLALALTPRNAAGNPPNPDAVELVGWLDLPWDDAPVLIVTALNEEAISSQEPLLPLLPPPLIESLGIGHPQQRHARNLYALSLMQQTRKHLRLISGRRDGDGNPNLISRLLLAEEDEPLVARVNSYFNFSGETRRRRWLWPRQGWAAQQPLAIPQPSEVPTLNSLSVTRFREYLKCPYRFYLNSVLGLEPVNDSLREMDGGAFGNLAHDVLEEFGREPIRLSDDSREIFEFLDAALERKARRFQQQSWFAAVDVQVESLRERLRAFAEVQAAQRAAGWEIIAAEQKAQYELATSKGPFLINGKIDRIDRHRDGRLAVWDYKTSDSGTKVDKAHRDSAGEWLDLQLPLYRYLLENVPVVGAEEARRQRDCLQLGYILLPRSVKDVAFDPAEWDADALASADALARRIVTCIQERIYWPPADEPPQFSEPLAAICQDNVFERSVSNG